VTRHQRPSGPARSNAALGALLDEAAGLLEHQGANPFRVGAYRSAAESLRNLPVSVATLYADEGVPALESIHGVGPGISRVLEGLLTENRFPLLERLRGESEPADPLTSVTGIGPALARRLHDDLGITTLQEAAQAVRDGRMAGLTGVGPTRLAAISAGIDRRLSEGSEPCCQPPPPVSELLEVDRQYLDAAGRGELPTIAPRRFNRTRRAWLPVLHTTRGSRHYTALFSNTAHAHRLGRTRDWVVIYSDGERDEHQATVVTARTGPLAGRRVVRGRESETAAYYRDSGVPY
jgi:DNA polymerase (family X)